MKAHWASYFGRLYQADLPAVELDLRGVTIPIADPPINYDPPSFVETQAAVNWLKWGQAPGICSIHAGLLKTGGNAVIMFYALPGTQASSQLTGRGTLLSLSGKGRVIARTATTTEGRRYLNTNVQSSQALHRRGQQLTVSLILGSSPNADEIVGSGCLHPMLISAKHSIR